MENCKTLLFFGLIDSNCILVGKEEIPEVGDLINIINIPSPIKLDGSYKVKETSIKQKNGKEYPRIHTIRISDDTHNDNMTFDFSKRAR